MFFRQPRGPNCPLVISLGICCALFAHVASGQHRNLLRLVDIGIEQGLSSYQVTALLEDRLGFLWIGTTDGLNRYDGYAITQYRAEGGAQRRISDNYINALYETRDGKIWIVSQRNVDIYDPISDSFRRLEEISASAGVVFLPSISEAHGSVWIGSNNGLFRFDAEGKSIAHYSSRENGSGALQSGLITAITTDGAGNLWVATAGGLQRYNAKVDAFVDAPKPLAVDSNVTDPGIVYALYTDGEGTVWIGMDGYIHAWQPGTASVDSFRLPVPAVTAPGQAEVISIEAYEQGSMLIGTAELGLFALYPASNTWHRYVHGEAETSLTNNTITALLWSRGGILWIGTWNGLSYQGLQQPFTTLIDGRVNAVHIDHDPRFVWVGTLGEGLFRLDLETGQRRRYQLDPSDATSLAHNDIWSLEVDHEGILWVATANGGLNKFNADTESFTRFRHADSTGLQDDRLYSVVEDATGRLWIGTLGAGVGLMDKSVNTFKHYRFDPTDTLSVQHYSVWPIHQDRHGRMWLGTVGGGLERFERAGGYFTHFQTDSNDTTSISGSRILTINEDSAGNLWVGSMGAGLNRYDEVDNRFIRFDENDGLPHNNIVCILPGQGESLWIATLEGLSHYDPTRASRFINYFDRDGLPTNTFQSNACHQGPDGRLYFGTERGLVAFYPEQISPKEARSVRLTGFELFNKPAFMDTSITHKRIIKLPHDKNFVTFRFSALDFSSSEKSMFAYKLDGLDENWISVKGQNAAGYPGLLPGRYMFNVKGATGNGLWSSETSSVQLVILPPIWQTRGAFTLYGMLGLLFVFGISRVYLRWQHNRLEKEALERDAVRLAQLANDKMRFFANISHEFRTPLTLIMGPLTHLIERHNTVSKEELRTAHHMMLRNSQRLLRLINQILALTRFESNKPVLKVRERDLVAFVRDTVQAFQPLAEAYNLILTASFPPQPIPIYFNPDAMEHILANLLSNALKFTPESGTVHVALQDASDRIIIVFKDTGPGIGIEYIDDIFKRFYQVDDSATRSYEGTGIGLALVQEMVALHHGEVSVESELGVGSTFFVKLWKGSSHFASNQIVPDRDELTHENAMFAESHGMMPSFYPTETMVGSKEPVNDDLEATTVLVVEDNADMRLFLHGIFSGYYRVLEASHGLEGLEQARKHLPDLIVADVMMEEMNGIELCRSLKNDPMTASIPVLIHSARASEKDILEGLDTEVDGYLVKPALPSIIRAQVRNLIGQRRRLREQFLAGTFPVQKPERERESRELSFLREKIHQNMSDPAFNVQALAEACNMSYASIYDLIKKELNVTPVELLRVARLEAAAELLRSGAGNVSEVAYGVGFDSLSYFGKRFKEHFGTPPSRYMKAF